MRSRHIRHHTTVWIAALAILLAALAPSLSQALRRAQGGPATEVCTAQGTRWVQDAPEGPGTPHGAAQLMAHCLYCATHVPTLGLPPAATTLVLVQALSQAVPAAFLSAPHRLHAWLSAQPRAPPQPS